MKRLTKYLIVALVALTLFTLTAEAASADTTFVPTPPTNADPSLGLRGPYGTTPPSTGTPRPTYVTPGGGLIGPGAVDIGDLVCIAWDYVKEKCAAWRNKNKATDLEVWNAYGGGPIANHLWVSGNRATYAELGYFGTHNNANRYCHAWDYTYGKCVGWNPAVPPYIAQYPVLNYIWANPATLTYQRKGYFGSTWNPWYS